MPPKFLISYQETRFLVTACFHYKITFHREHLWRDRKETGNSEPLRGMGGGGEDFCFSLCILPVFFLTTWKHLLKNED